jgi:hypothetical protein
VTRNALLGNGQWQWAWAAVAKAAISKSNSLLAVEPLLAPLIAFEQKERDY